MAAHPLVIATSFVERALRLPPSIDCAAWSTPSLRSARLAGDDQRRGAVQAARCRATGRAAPSSSACRCRGIGGGIAALEVGERGARQPGILGRHLEARDLAVLELGDQRRAGGGELVEAVAMDDPGALAAELAQHFGDRLHPVRREDADELALGAGRVRQRPEQIEDGARAELDAGRPDMAHGAVIARRHEEADAGLDHGALHDARRRRRC